MQVRYFPQQGKGNYGDVHDMNNNNAAARKEQSYGFYPKLKVKSICKREERKKTKVKVQNAIINYIPFHSQHVFSISLNNFGETDHTPKQEMK